MTVRIVSMGWHNGLHLEYNGAPSIDYLPFYKLFLSYARLVETCTSQNEVDFLKECLKKDIKIEELNIEIIQKQAKLSRLEELLETHKDLINEIKKLVFVKKEWRYRFCYRFLIFGREFMI